LPYKPGKTGKLSEKIFTMVESQGKWRLAKNMG